MDVNLIIGGFKVGCEQKRTDIKCELPASCIPFLDYGISKADFKFHTDYMQANDSKILLYGADASCCVPTFVYQRNDGRFEWLTQKPDGSTLLAFLISEDWVEFSLYQDETGTKGEKAFWEFASLFACAILKHGACVLHGVVMEYRGMGILVCGASGTGKTTHTSMWVEQEHARIINGDRCLCRKVDGVWYAYGMPWAGSSRVYRNQRVPITAIVALRQDKQNSVRRMEPFESALTLMQRIFAPVWPGELQNRAYDITEELSAAVPILELSCKPDFEAVDVLKEAIEKLVG